MSAREIRRDDVVRSKITGRTGPVLRVEQYDDGTPRITVEITKVAETGGPIHHFELVKSVDEGRVHDVVAAERQAYAEIRPGVDEYECPVDGCDYLIGAVGPVDPDEPDYFAEDIEAHRASHLDDGRVHDVAEAERMAYCADSDVTIPNASGSVCHGGPAILCGNRLGDDRPGTTYGTTVCTLPATHDGPHIARHYGPPEIDWESWGNEPPEDEDDVDRVDPDDPTSMVVPVPGDRVLMADGGTARVTARRMDGDELSLQVQRPRMGYAEWVGVEAIAGVSEPEDDASATVETVGDSGDGDSVALHESQHVALDGQDRTHRDCCVAGAVALGGHEVADGLDAHAYSGEQIPPLRDQLAQLHDEIRRPIHHMDSSSVGPEAATSGNPLIVEVNPGLACVDSSADRTGRDVPLVVSSQAGLSAIRHGVVPMDDAAGVLELAHEVVRAAHRWADTELDVPWVHDDERQRAARAGSRELRAAVRAHRAAGGAS